MRLIVSLFLLFFISLSSAAQAQNYEAADERLKQRIERKISKIFDNGTIDVQVSVLNGDVILDGWLTTGAQKYVLESILSSVDGIRSLQNNTYIDLLRNDEY
jgi:osmotically-inducible protein OsmY